MIHILTTSFNTSPYIEKCLNSIKLQTIQDFQCWICDDVSTDGSQSYIECLIDSNPQFHLIANKQKLWQGGNYFHVLQNPSIHDEDIILLVDGDDYLPDSKVFERILEVYQKDIWITYGQYLITTDKSNVYTPGMCQEPNFNDLRNFSDWTISHLRTFKAWLFRKIKEEDLKYEGQFFDAAGDLSFMLPMMEMAGKEHSKFTPEINYIYNAENPLNDHKVKLSNQLKYREIIQKMKPYTKL